MAATPKKPQVMKLDYSIDRAVYDEFVRVCVKSAYSPKIVVERLIKKFIEGGGKI